MDTEQKLTNRKKTYITPALKNRGRLKDVTEGIAGGTDGGAGVGDDETGTKAG